MAEWREIPIRDLPPELTWQVHEKIRLHAVTMVVATADSTEPFCCSGTFTQVKGMAGILTARHVWTRIERARNRLLGGRRPLEALAAGEAKAVREAAAAYVEGAYV